MAGVLVVGAGLAGATVAGTLRDSGWEEPITLIGAESELPYERPALSKAYLAGTTDAASLLVHPAGYYAEQDIALRLGERVAGLDVDRREVRLASGELLPYDALVIATGALNARPPIPGIELAGVHQLRTLADADALRASAATARTAVVVGMGFIGCETAATLTGLGLAVTAVDGAPGPLWGPLGPELSGVVRRWHEQHGVRVLTGRGVAALHPDPTGFRVGEVELDDGRRLPADLVVVGVGVRPTTDWLSDAPLHLSGGAVGVDLDGRTNLPGVFAVGDVTATWDPATGRHRRTEHWASAVAQGRRVGRLLAGLSPEQPEPPYFWSDQYDRTLQYAGAHDPEPDVVLRGDPEGSLTAFFLREGTLTAVLAVDDGRQFRRARALLGTAPDPELLASTDLSRQAAAVRAEAQLSPGSPPPCRRTPARAGSRGR